MCGAGERKPRTQKPSADPIRVRERAVPLAQTSSDVRTNNAVMRKTTGSFRGPRTGPKATRSRRRGRRGQSQEYSASHSSSATRNLMRARFEPMHRLDPNPRQHIGFRPTDREDDQLVERPPDHGCRRKGHSKYHFRVQRNGQCSTVVSLATATIVTGGIGPQNSSTASGMIAGSVTS